MATLGQTYTSALDYLEEERRKREQEALSARTAPTQEQPKASTLSLGESTVGTEQPWSQLSDAEIQRLIDSAYIDKGQNENVLGGTDTQTAEQPLSEDYLMRVGGSLTPETLQDLYSAGEITEDQYNVLNGTPTTGNPDVDSVLQNLFGANSDIMKAINDAEAYAREQQSNILGSAQPRIDQIDQLIQDQMGVDKPTITPIDTNYYENLIAGIEKPTLQTGTLKEYNETYGRSLLTELGLASIDSEGNFKLSVPEITGFVSFDNTVDENGKTLLERRFENAVAPKDPTLRETTAAEEELNNLITQFKGDPNITSDKVDQLMTDRFGYNPAEYTASMRTLREKLGRGIGGQTGLSAEFIKEYDHKTELEIQSMQEELRRVSEAAFGSGQTGRALAVSQEAIAQIQDHRSQKFLTRSQLDWSQKLAEYQSLDERYKQEINMGAMTINQYMEEKRNYMTSAMQGVAIQLDNIYKENNNKIALYNAETQLYNAEIQKQYNITDLEMKNIAIQNDNISKKYEADMMAYNAQRDTARMLSEEKAREVAQYNNNRIAEYNAEMDAYTAELQKAGDLANFYLTSIDQANKTNQMQYNSDMQTIQMLQDSVYKQMMSELGIKQEALNYYQEEFAARVMPHLEAAQLMMVAENMDEATGLDWTSIFSTLVSGVGTVVGEATGSSFIMALGTALGNTISAFG